MSFRELLKEKNQKLKTSLKISKNKTLRKSQKNDENEEQEENMQNAKIEIFELSNNLLKIIKGNHYYLLDRYKYDINTIMMLLDLTKINKLHEFYKNYPDGIEKIHFVQKMKKEIPYNLNDPMDGTNLVYGLYKFFCEIDFNGDGHMQWEEFTQFIIDTVEGDSDAKVDENEDDNKTKIFNEKKMFKYKRYIISMKLKDNVIHKREVISAVFIPRADLIVVNEYGTKLIKLYNPKTGKNEKIFDLETFINPQNYSSLTDNKYKKKSDIFLKKTNNNTKNTIYSVLSMTQYQNIVAMCLSDKRIIFLQFASDDRIEFIHEMHLPVLEKRIWYLREHNIWVCSGCKLDKYMYYTLNELDIEFEIYNQKYQCLFNENHPYRKHYCDINPHRGEIMDCIEIIRPMMIITACMDGKIRLFNISNRESIKIWNYHDLGVRSLDYNPLIEGIGYIVSVGFEYYINLYCADLSIDEAYKGKLEGHYAPVISCKFIAHSYMAVSVDEEANVRIWDTRLKVCLQLIGPPKKKCKINNILGLFKYNKFMIYGNKIIYYDAKYKEEDNIETNQVKDDNYPIKIEYNYYYQQFFVATFKDIRVYSKDGQINKIYKKLNANEHFDNSDVKIKNFIFENNYRKFYVGFSNGAIMQFNAGNGSLIKTVNENEVEKDGILVYEYSHSKDISSLYFYKKENDDNNLLLLSTSFDSIINVYNEQNPEETEQLRKIRGGHTINGKSHEILCMDFSLTLNLFATGGSDGLTVVWDFEMSKIDEVLFINLSSSYKISINYLKFLDPYSILAATYSDGTLYFWGVKKHKNEGECIFRARNYDKALGRIDICNIKYMNIYCGNIEGIEYDVPLKKYFDENSPFMNKDKHLKNQKNNNTNNKYSINQNKNTFKHNEKNSEDEEEKKNDNEIEKEENLDIVPDIYKDEIIDKEIDRDLYEEKEIVNIENNNNIENKDKNEEIKPQYYLILGDERGNIKIIDLIGYLKKNNIEPSSKIVIKSTFNLYKKDDINVSAIINHNLSTKKEKILPKFTNMYYKMIIKEFKAHYEEITCISVIYEPLSFVTCSKDEYVKIFNFKCECIGVINALPKMSKFPTPEIKWNFKINEKKILEKEILDVVNIFEKVGVEAIKIGGKVDMELNEIKLEDKKEENKENTKKTENINKKRFKPILKEENAKRRSNSEIGIGYISYEGFYVQNSQKKIESLFNKEYPNIGINEITNKLIGTMVETEKTKKMKIKENKGKEVLINNSFKTTSPTPSHSGKKRTIAQKSNTNNNLKHILNNMNLSSFNRFQSKNEDINNKNIYTSSIFSPISKQIDINTNNRNDHMLILSNTTKENNIKINDNNIIGKKIDFSQRALSLDNNINKMNLFMKRKTSVISSKNSSFISLKENNQENNDTEKEPPPPKKVEIKKIKKNIINHNSSNNNSLRKKVSFLKLRKKKKINPNFRDELLTLRLYKKNYPNNNLDEISSSNADKTLVKLQNIKLPHLYDKIIFKKGETEKLLNYQFYSNSYRSCCETKVQNGINNLPLKTNYKNNWKYVKHFAEQKHKENEKQKLKKNNSKKIYEIFKKDDNNNNLLTDKYNIYSNAVTNRTNYKTSLPSEQQNNQNTSERYLNL